VPCQGLDLGRVITKRPPLSDFALRRTPIFRVDEALAQMAGTTAQKTLLPPPAAPHIVNLEHSSFLKVIIVKDKLSWPIH